MALVLNEEQAMLREVSQQFLAENAGVDARRRLRDDKDALGYSPATWSAMTELGWPGILVPEAAGGLDFGHVGMGQVSELCGRSLAASPLFATAIAGVTALTSAGNGAIAGKLLPGVVDGSVTLALAVDESPRHDPTAIASTAIERDGGFVLSGRKVFVVDGHCASTLIVAATLSDGATGLFAIDRTTSGIVATRVPMVDSSNAAIVEFKDVAIDPSSMLLRADTSAFEGILDACNAHLAAELLGIATECLERTVEYLKERRQFGLPIGSFQGLQHRAAELWTDVELTKSIVLRALQALDADDDESAKLASAAKSRACRTVERATNEAIQMHGGIGMTDEADIGFFLKRARVLQALFGDHRYHAARYARLGGY